VSPFELFEDHGSRTSNGDKGSKKTGELNKFKVEDREACEKECLQLGEACSDYEYSSRGNRYEVWKVHISQVNLEYVNGFDCFIKN